METVQEVIEYLEAKLDKTIDTVKYMRAKGHEDYFKYVQRMYVIEEILEEIDP